MPQPGEPQLVLFPNNLCHIHTDRSKESSYSVVQLSGDASPLLILSLQQTGRKFGFLVSFFRSITLRDVSRHFGGSNDAVRRVFHRRNSQRNIDPRAIIAQPYSFEVVHAVASPQLLKNSYLFVPAVGRDRGSGEFDEQVQRSEAIEQA